MAETIQKEARKASADPVQEALRQHKDTWNHETSLLIAQLIAFKRGLNGRGEPKVGLPPGSIKDPVPSEVGSYLAQLAERYNKLISDAHSIIDEQKNYSENRKKSQKESGQPVIASNDEEIIKIASWWGSRAKTYAKNSYVSPWYWFAAKEEVKVRMKLLKISTDFVKKFEQLDSFVVSKDNKAIPNAIYDFDKFISAFIQLIIPNMEKLIKIDKVILQNDAENINEPKKEELESVNVKNDSYKNDEIKPIDSVKKEQENITNEELNSNQLELSGEESAYAFGLSPKEMVDDVIFTGPIAIIMQKISPKDKNTFQADSSELRKKLDQFILSGKGDIDKIQLEYANLLKLSNSILKLNSQNFNSQLKEIESEFNKKSAQISFEFEKLAANFMTRWLKRQKLKLMSDSNDRVRLIASDKIKTILQAFDVFQNALENDEQSLDFIIKKIEIIVNKIGSLGETLYHLGKNHNDEYEQARLNGKPLSHLIRTETLNKLPKLKETLTSELLKIK